MSGGCTEATAIKVSNKVRKKIVISTEQGTSDNFSRFIGKKPQNEIMKMKGRKKIVYLYLIIFFRKESIL